MYIYIYIYAFSRRLYPKRLTVHSGYIFFSQYVCSLGIEPTTFCAANAMLYHWATGTLCSCVHNIPVYCFKNLALTYCVHINLLCSLEFIPSIFFTWSQKGLKFIFIKPAKVLSEPWAIKPTNYATKGVVCGRNAVLKCQICHLDSGNHIINFLQTSLIKCSCFVL